ncbi:MAG: LysR family transcriptional regulator [Anaeroplasmataceae bacterium]|nr:LysR family transcriptional regulator [Anaeroplasmataceae bacterium]
MDDPRLTTLLTLIQIKNYTRTAQELYITQPAVTNHIKSLEHEFDVELFKDKKTFALTEQGKILVEYARRMRNQNRELSEAIKSSLSSQRTLNLAVTESCQSILSKDGFLDLLFQSYPTEANIAVMDKNTIFEKLNAGKLDFAIVDTSYDDEAVDGLLLATYHLVPVCYKEGKFKEIKRITRAMLKSNPIILGNEHEGMTSLALRTIQSANINLSHNLIYHSNTFYLMGQLIENKDGIGFMYQELVEQIPNVKKMELSNFEGHQDIYLLYSQNSFDKAIIRELFRRLRIWLKK